ncbi:M16 family metallopeptidase [Rummeliibacillus stabekisii]|uniref:Zinc protease n=1 Tax=Rummeliibacillus stabekisii TaxID=241244 RepID=A0A143HAI4_9BACL|nr:pitrilysin family protein [Rummeliibacillus stabekisii]AMW98536.1 zinc protease [Rummeliibacillus stabekisii]
MRTKHICKNGVRILVEKRPYVRSVSMGIWVNVGSRDESPELNGITHFIEHMLFKGTYNRTAKEIAESFDRIGGQLNAFTSKENTCFYATTLDIHAVEALKILADMFFHSSFDPQEIEKERQVIYEEMLLVEDTPDDEVDERLWRAMFPDDPIGAPILGTRDTLETFTKETLEDFMEAHYTPERIVISIAGNVPDHLLDTVVTLFGDFERDSEVPQIATIPRFDPGVTIKRNHAEQSHLLLGYSSLSIKDPNLTSLLVMNNIIGDTTSSRLFQQVREEKALAYSIYSYYSAYQDTGAFMIYGGTSPKQLDILEETILQITDNLKENGVTAKEIKYAKEQLESNFLLSLETTNDVMHRNAKNELIYGEHKSIEVNLEELQAVNEISVNNMIQDILGKPFAKSIIQPTKRL